MPSGIYPRTKKRGGWKLPEETKKKLSENNARYWFGKKLSEEHKRKLSEVKKGKKLSEEHRKKISEAGKKEKNHFWGKHHSLETRKKISEARKSKKLSEETRQKMREVRKGNKNPSWQGGKSFEPYSIDWTETLRRSIRERDNYICQLCSQYGNNVHHIDYNKKNCNPDNLIILCRSCNIKVNKNRDYWTNYFKGREKN